MKKQGTGLVWGSSILAFMFVAAAVSQAKLQLIDRTATLARAKDNKLLVKENRDIASRGNILSSDGKVLARDDETSLLTVEFDKAPNSPGFWAALSEASGIPATEFESLAESDVSIRTWPKPMAASDRSRIVSVTRRWRAEGVAVKGSGRRSYPLGAASSLIVGICRTDEPRIKTGIEASLDSYLTGMDGVRSGLADRNGRILPLRETSGTTKRRDGQDVVLTIDSDLQQLATTEIRKAVEKYKAKGGAAVIMDPSTGDLLAIAAWPSFEPYEPDGSPTHIAETGARNAATMFLFEPGSTMKVLTLAIALNEHKINMHSLVHCTGTWQPKKSLHVKCDLKHGAHGTVDPTMAIAKSCNIAAAQWALAVGRNSYLNYVHDLGLVTKPKIGLGSIIRGRYDPNEPAKELQLSRIGFGQSLSTTPISLAGAFSMLANDGKRIAPRLVKQLGDMVQPPAAPAEIVRPEVAHEVLKAMEAVFANEHGTGHGLQIPGYRLAGKTGTAQKVGKGLRGHVANFVGFVPAQKPKVVIMVMVDDPQGDFYGSSVAGPVFRQIALGTIRHFRIPPTEPVKSAELPNKAKKRQNT